MLWRHECWRAGMLEGLPIVGWFLSKLKRRPRRPQTHLNIVVYGDVINSNINVNVPGDSELRIGTPSDKELNGDPLPADTPTEQRRDDQRSPRIH